MSAHQGISRKKEEFTSLTAFTTLEPVAVGSLVGLLFIRGSQIHEGLDYASLVILVIALLALLTSLFHLGRPWRAPLAILHPSTSWLSREIILFSFFLLMLFSYMVLPIFVVSGFTIHLAGFMCAIFGLASTFATGKTYQLRARPSWDHWSTILSFPLGALSTGILFGLFIEQLFTGDVQIGRSVRPILTILLSLILFIFSLRLVTRSQRIPEVSTSRSLAVGAYLWLYLLRVITILITISMLWVSDTTLFFAWVPALVGEFADRSIFFNTVIPITLVGRYI